MIKSTNKSKFAVVASDVVIFSIIRNQLCVLLIKMKKSPFANFYAVPGGMVKTNESVDDSAKRHLKDKAGLSNVYLEQLYTFGDVKRDPFGRVVSVAYFALIPNGSKIKLKTTTEYSEVIWSPINKLPKLAYDHATIIKYANERLQSKLEYTNVVYSLLPELFTLTDLQKVYELILAKQMDKRNFRKKIISLGIIKTTGKKRKGEANRPAELYQFVSRTPKIVQVL